MRKIIVLISLILTVAVALPLVLTGCEGTSLVDTDVNGTNSAITDTESSASEKDSSASGKETSADGNETSADGNATDAPVTDGAETEPDYGEDTRELYEREFVEPSRVAITDKDGNAKNLIYIFLESMETTYASSAVGGAQPSVNYIPNLTALAQNNLSFSDGKGLGGFRSVQGTGWTMGALLGITSGVPFNLAVFGEGSNNSLGKDGTFMNGLTTLGDILAEKGYNQEFLCGSQASFGGRKTYFQVHGNYEIFDLYTARKEGYIPKDYYVWWGYEDHILYDIAKDEILELAEKDEPFNFTMLTVDTHHNRGYICSECGDEYSVQLANVVSCADRLLGDFIEWCSKQDFYEDTTIVIVGDHPRMDYHLVSGVDFFDRTIYNCIINSAVQPKGEVTDRAYSSLDMFPTVLAAMGFEIAGDRLGLGVNMFSGKKTLCEKYGLEEFNNELSLDSQYYREHFLKEKE